ncbi:MAG: alpha/beta hydrolase fold domain-containing protein [Micrococcales bacterium]
MTEKPVWIPPKHGMIPNPVTTADGYKRYDVSYSIKLGFRPIELELFVPESQVPIPLIIWIHGGGYAGGTRKEEAPWIEKANYVGKSLMRGFAIARIDYRLGREASFPEAVHDAHAALRWLAKFSPQLNLNISKVVVWGASAGAHLGALTVNTFGDPYFEGTDGAEPSSDLKVVGFVDWFGASDLNTIVRPMDGTDAALPEVARFPPEYFNLGEDRWQSAEWRKKASPTTYIHEGSPETLLVHGDADSMVPIQQSHVLMEKLAQAGVPHELVSIPGAEHAWMGTPQNEVDRIVDLSLDWIERVTCR